MMLGLPAVTSPFKLSRNEFGDEVLVDSTGRIIAGDPGQPSIGDYLQNAVLAQASTKYDGPLAPNYVAYAALAVAAFFVIKGLSK